MLIKRTLKLFSIFPKHHALAASVIGACLILGMNSPVSSSTARTLVDIDLPATPESALPISVTPVEIEVPKTQTLTVQSGDTLSTLFDRAKLPINDMYSLLGAGKDGKALARLMPNETFEYRLEDNQIVEFVRKVSNLKSIHFARGDKGFTSETVELTPERRLKYKATALKGNLFDSAEAIGAPIQIIMQMASVFGGVMDFVYDPREGDKFSVLYEEFYLEGELIGVGDVLATQYTNEDRVHEAYRYEDQHGDASYYDAKGVSMRKAFLRAPVDFTRISSNFNPNRLHPIFKTKRPHRGTDYAAATGTPVYSAGDGRVVKATYNKPSGNYVVIQHGPRYQTKYLHLNKRKVKTGQRVKQGQVIGTVGSTGYATGPHLHYEFLLDGVHRNPRTILKKLPKAKSIAAKQMAHFQAAIDPVQRQFVAYQRTSPLFVAQASTRKNNQG